MTTVYLLTTGDYSDYTVEGVFSTEKAAQQAATKYDSGDADVTDFEVDAMDVAGRWLQYTCQLDADGHQAFAVDHWRDPDYSSRVRRRHGECWTGEVIRFSGYSDRSAEDAYRLASEARQEWLRRKALGQLPEQQPIDDPPGEWKCKD